MLEEDLRDFILSSMVVRAKMLMNFAETRFWTFQFNTGLKMKPFRCKIRCSIIETCASLTGSNPGFASCDPIFSERLNFPENHARSVCVFIRFPFTHRRIFHNRFLPGSVPGVSYDSR